MAVVLSMLGRRIAGHFLLESGGILLDPEEVLRYGILKLAAKRIIRENR